MKTFLIDEKWHNLHSFFVLIDGVRPSLIYVQLVVIDKIMQQVSTAVMILLNRFPVSYSEHGKGE